MLPFSTPKQTLLLAFLNTALPPSSTGLSALGITSVVQDYTGAVANVSLAALISSNHATFESQLNSTAALASVAQQFTLSNLTGYHVSVASMAAAPQLSIASQVPPATPTPASSLDGNSAMNTQHAVVVASILVLLWSWLASCFCWSPRVPTMHRLSAH